MESIDQYFLKQDPRYKHSKRVSEKVKEIITLKYKELGISSEEEKKLIYLAKMHEIGFCERIKKIDYPPIDGYLALRDEGIGDSYCKAVLFMSNAEELAKEKKLDNAVTFYKRVHEKLPLTNREKLYIDILTYADLTTDSRGEDINLEKAHAEVKYFYGESSPESNQFLNHFDDHLMMKLKFSI